MTLPSPARAAGQKRGEGGCGTVLIMFAAVAVLGGITFAVFLARAFSTDSGQEITRGFSEIATLVQEAQTAPGAEDVAKEGGCLQALVMDADKLAALSQSSSNGDGGKSHRGLEKTLVTCQTGFGKTPPECQALAQVYVRAAHPSAPFRVAVQKQGDPNRSCDRVFDVKGQPVVSNPEATAAINQAIDDAGVAALLGTASPAAPVASSALPPTEIVTLTAADGGAH